MDSLSATCPLCETTPPAQSTSRSQPDSISLVGRQEQIARLLHKAQRLDDALRSILERKHATLRELNHVQAHTSSLPFELLSYIFQLASPPIDFSKRTLCESEDGNDLDNMTDSGPDTYPKPRNQVDLRYRYFPLILGAVCSSWRKVAWGTPELWTTFAVEVIERRLNAQIPLIRLYLTNSGTHPVSLDLDMRVQQCAYLEKHEDNAPLIQLSALQCLANLVFDEFPRNIKTLRLAGAPSAWMVYLSEGRLPNLRDLTFGWGVDAGDMISVKLEGGAFTAAPREWNPVDNLELPPSLRQIPIARPPLPPLTTLHLRSVHIEICAKILYYTPGLVEYHAYDSVCTSVDSASPETWHFTPFQELYSLPNLKHFGWTVADAERVSTDLLTNIRLPSLEEVQLSGITEDLLIDDAEALFTFFSNLPLSLNSLSYYAQDTEFFETSDDYLHFCRVFSTIPQTRTLMFNKCSGSFLISIFSLLSTKFPNNKPQCLLPSLDRIVVKHLDQDDDDMSVAFVEMVKTRRSVLQSQSFIFEADCEMTWSRSAQDGLRELAYDFALTVTENAEEKSYGYFTDRELDIFTSGLDKGDESARQSSSQHRFDLWAYFRDHSWSTEFINSLSSTSTAAESEPSASSSTATAVGGGQIDSMAPVPIDGSMSGSLFSPEFMQGVASALDDIDRSLFRPDGDLNFERDFGQWFNNPDDSLDLM